MTTGTDHHTPLRIERSTGDFLNHSAWQPIGLTATQRQHRQHLIMVLGRWTQDHDSDILGGPRMPPALQAMAQELSRLDAADGPLAIRANQSEAFRATAHGITVHLTVTPRTAPNDPLGYDPEGWRIHLRVSLHGQTIGTPTWMTPQLLRQCRDSNQGYGDFAEVAYDLAYHMWHALESYLRFARFDGYTYH